MLRAANAKYTSHPTQKKYLRDVEIKSNELKIYGVDPVKAICDMNEKDWSCMYAWKILSDRMAGHGRLKNIGHKKENKYVYWL